MMLAVENVTCRFGGLTAVSDVSLEIEQGALLGLIGRNGAGKTTLFNLIAGRFPPTSGRIVLDGRDITRLPAHHRARLGIARTFQIPEPLTHLTLFENVLVGAFLRHARRADAEAEAATVLALTGLSAKANHRSDQLTTPDLKRLELARALASKPKLLLLDEVMAGLRPSEVDEAIDLCRAIHASGVTLIFVEHVMYAVMKLCKRVVVLDQGEVIADGSATEVTSDERVIDLYLGRRHAA